MSRKKLIFTIIFLLGVIGFYLISSEDSLTGKVIGDSNEESGLKIANWNLQIFGVSKASNIELMNFYADKINDYDVIFVQEIRDETGTAFSQLCSMLEGYSCDVSSRAGRTSSKEQYGVIFKENIKLSEAIDYNPDMQNRWERPPIEVSFDLGNYILTIFNIHVKPDDVKNELDFLDDLVLNEGYTAVIGDLNADCSYYDNQIENEFEDWYWVIEDNEDTTSGKSNCAYDRIIVSDLLKEKVIRSGIEKNEIDEESDHYLIWFEIRR